MRDANGNLTMVNGQVTSSIYQQRSRRPVWRRRRRHAAVRGQTYGQATAIGNSLNVVVAREATTPRSSNSTQTNNGNQTATTDLNAH